MKHIFIPEFSCAGHYSVYLENISKAYLHAGYFVTITILEEFQYHLAIQKLKSQFQETFRLEVITDKEHRNWLRSNGGNIGGELANWFLFKRKFTQVNLKLKIDYVFFPYVDYCMHFIGLLGSPFRQSPWSGICMSTAIHHARYKFSKSKIRFIWIKEFIFFKLLKIKYLDKIFTIDELMLIYTLEKQPNLKKRIQYLADPAELRGNHNRESARKVLGISDRAVVVLVYGTINTRKGIDALVSAVHHRDSPKTIYILVVGELDKSIESLFKSKEAAELIENGKIQIYNKFADATMQQMAFASTDIVWLGYNNHLYMSGVLVLAAMARKVIIATDNGLIGWYTREKRLGLTVDIENNQAIIKALVELSDDLTRLNYQKNISSVFDAYTWDNAIKCILSSTKTI